MTLHEHFVLKHRRTIDLEGTVADNAFFDRHVFGCTGEGAVIEVLAHQAQQLLEGVVGVLDIEEVHVVDTVSTRVHEDVYPATEFHFFQGITDAVGIDVRQAIAVAVLAKFWT